MFRPGLQFLNLQRDVDLLGDRIRENIGKLAGVGSRQEYAGCFAILVQVFVILKRAPGNSSMRTNHVVIGCINFFNSSHGFGVGITKAGYNAFQRVHIILKHIGYAHPVAWVAYVHRV